MIIYVLNNKFLTKVNLPLKIDGVYPLYTKDKKFIGNIESVNNEYWTLNLGTNLTYYDRTLEKVEKFTNCILQDNVLNEYYYFFAIPLYDETAQKYNVLKNEIVISKENADINYLREELKNGLIKLIYNGTYWNLETNLDNIFVNEKRVKNTRIYNGDYLFIYGLKIIIIDKLFIIGTNKGSLNKDAFKEILKTPYEQKEYPNLVAEDVPLYNASDYYFKAPRFDSLIQEERVVISEPPNPIKENDMPLILIVGPQLTMVATSVFSLVNYVTMYMQGNSDTVRFVIALSTILITIVGALLWPSLTRAFNTKRNKALEEKRQEKYKKYLAKKRLEIEQIQAKQKQIMLENTSSPENCKLIIDTRQRVLWQRSITDNDFLKIRLGIGTVDAKINIDMPEEKFTIEDEDNLLTEMKKVVNSSLKISNVPLNVSLISNKITAILGNNSELTKRFTDNLFLQLMTFHAYTDLKIIVFTNDKTKWDYLKILPHIWDNHKTIRYFGTNSEETSLIASELEKIFDSRVNNDESEKLEDNGKEDEDKEAKYKNYKPYYLIFTDDIKNTRNISLIKKILNYQKNLGFSLLILNDRLVNLPSETTTFINIDQNVSGLITNELSVNNQYQFVADIYNNIDIYECAKKLANIPISIEKEKYELPNSLSFLELYDVGKVELLNSSERWRTNNPVNSLSVPIGVDQNGEIFKMDIHEKSFGPHGLVAGTTGSGKSEWLITYILSLAVNFHPDEVQFVFIDYKGGGLAMSFENSELGIKLPHLAGTITNLDKSEINRAIESIESELKRRQQIFNEAREKLKEGSMNIYKYQQFYRKGLVTQPLSHLLIICDEFAELKSQQPEFMDQLISTSRIGRSLGVHLILATQKPSGVVNDQIWSNSKFKVCLKVQDRSDSNEILRKPDAAFLKQTGSFYISVGNDDYYNLGQAAWAGAKYFPSDIIKKKVDQSVEYIDNIGKTINYYDNETEKETKEENHGEELINIVSYIDKVSKNENIKGRKLWLPNIKPIIYLSELNKKYNHKFEKFNYDIPIGEYDEPRRQEQGLLKIDLAKGNIAIIGQMGAGKELLLSTIIWSSIVEHTPYEINYYILDFGAETLKKFAKFPHVGEVVFQDEIDKVAGVVQLVLDEIEKRKELLSEYNGSFEYYNKVSDKKLPLVVLAINAYDIFEENIPKLDDLITSLFRDAPRYGVIFIVTASSSSAIRSRQLQYFNHVIMMQMQDEGIYRSITNCRKGLIPGHYYGRGICKIGIDDDTYCEFQTALICPSEQLNDYLRKVALELVNYYNYKAKQLAKVPDNVTSTDLVQYLTTLENVPIGYNFYEKDLAKYNFSREKIHLITSRELKNNVNFLYALASLLSKIPNVKVRVLDMLDIFKKPILDIKLFNDEYDTIMGALENDVLTRTSMQDYAVNIIIGVGQVKKKLSKGGLEIFENMMNKLISSNKVIMILVDDYDFMKLLKLESWYNNIDTTKGIWLGTGLSNQSIFQTNEVTSEDKKYNYEGLAFTINEATYTVIKTMMDGDE